MAAQRSSRPRVRSTTCCAMPGTPAGRREGTSGTSTSAPTVSNAKPNPPSSLPPLGESGEEGPRLSASRLPPHRRAPPSPRTRAAVREPRRGRMGLLVLPAGRAVQFSPSRSACQRRLHLRVRPLRDRPMTRRRREPEAPALIAHHRVNSTIDGIAWPQNRRPEKAPKIRCRGSFDKGCRCKRCIRRAERARGHSP